MNMIAQLRGLHSARPEKRKRGEGKAQFLVSSFRFPVSGEETQIAGERLPGDNPFPLLSCSLASK
jgi:hypothetical protein